MKHATIWKSLRPVGCGFLALACALLAAPAAEAVQPTVTAITPWGFSRGGEIEVVVQGQRLADAQEVLLYQTGVEVLSLEAEKADSVKLKLRVAEDCEPGLHAFRVRTASGLSNLRLFSVGIFPTVEEVEPNNDFNAPQEIALGVTVNGVVQAEDVDYFAVKVEKGERITAEIEGLWLGYTFFDPYIAILNDKRFELARSDDAALLRQDGVCSIIAPEAGTYIIQVRESAYGGDGNSKYRLHVGSFPRPKGVLPAGGRPGETLTVRWLGDPSGEFTSQVTLPNTPGDFGLRAVDPSGEAPSPNMVRVSDLPQVVETEPNDGRDEATPMEAPGAANGVIGQPGDVDHFRFSAKKGEQYDIRVHAREPHRSPLDSVLTVLRASNGSAVGSNDDTGGPDSYLRFNTPEDGDFIIQVRDHLNAGGEYYIYRVEISPVAPALTLGVAEKVQYEATTLPVPQGNRLAVMVSASRAGFGGELELALEGLPPGLTVHSIPMPEDRNEVPLLLEAAADAPLAGELVDLQARPVSGQPALVGHVKQRTMLIRGQNNTDVWGHDADRLAVAVTEAAPFQLQVAAPRVPIVRSGSMQLKVVAQRREGFTAPIAVRFLYNPPGLSSSGSVNIAEGQNEALIPVTANGNAPLRTWPIIVTGSAPHDGGRIEVAAAPFNLEVADSFFNVAFEKAACEQGQNSEVHVKLERKREFPGTAQVELLGLPAKTTTEPREAANEAAVDLTFPVVAAEDAPVGKHTSLVVRLVVTIDGEPVTQTVGGGELRIDKPLPPKAAPPAAAPKAEPKPTPQPEKPKVLSRLEQLRLEREKEREAGESVSPSP